ncbi:MAG: hypothetical protein ACPGOY_07395 [Rhodospirillaceae bacterium]
MTRRPAPALILVALSAALLAGCAAGETGPSTSGGGSGGAGSDLTACGGAALGNVIGGPLLATGQPAPTSGPFLRMSDLPAGARIITPNSAVTKDLRPDRLNVLLDDKSGLVTGLNCG